MRVGEPNLEMGKVVTAGATGSQAGDTVSWQIVIANTGDTTAFQVDWRDQLPAGLFQISNAQLSTAGGDVFLNGTSTPLLSSNLHVTTTTSANDTIDLASTAGGDAADTIQIEPGAAGDDHLRQRAPEHGHAGPGADEHDAGHLHRAWWTAVAAAPTAATTTPTTG